MEIRPRPSEYILISSGILLLIGIVLVATGGSFATWTAAKVLYGLGVVLFIFNV